MLPNWVLVPLLLLPASLTTDARADEPITFRFDVGMDDQDVFEGGIGLGEGNRRLDVHFNLADRARIDSAFRVLRAPTILVGRGRIHIDGSQGVETSARLEWNPIIFDALLDLATDDFQLLRADMRLTTDFRLALKANYRGHRLEGEVTLGATAGGVMAGHYMDYVLTVAEQYSELFSAATGVDIRQFLDDLLPVRSRMTGLCGIETGAVARYTAPLAHEARLSIEAFYSKIHEFCSNIVNGLVKKGMRIRLDHDIKAGRFFIEIAINSHSIQAIDRVVANPRIQGNSLVGDGPHHHYEDTASDTRFSIGWTF